MIYSLQWGLCASEGNELFVCRKEQKPSEEEVGCAVSIGGAAAPYALQLFLLVAVRSFARRSRA